MTGATSASDLATLRRGIAEIGDQLGRAAEGRFDLTVTTDVADLQPLAEQVNRVLDTVRKSLEQAQHRLLSATGHELKTPLNAVIGYSEMLLEDLDAAGDTARAEDVRKIWQSGTRLAALISELADPAKASA
jgi:signal transduction histidine kinase